MKAKRNSSAGRIRTALCLAAMLTAAMGITADARASRETEEDALEETAVQEEPTAWTKDAAGEETEMLAGNRMQVLKLALAFVPGSLPAQAARWFVNDLYEQTDHALYIENYDEGSLGTPGTLLEGLENGRIEMAMIPLPAWKLLSAEETGMKMLGLFEDDDLYIWTNSLSEEELVSLSLPEDVSCGADWEMVLTHTADGGWNRTKKLKLGSLLEDGLADAFLMDLDTFITEGHYRMRENHVTRGVPVRSRDWGGVLVISGHSWDRLTDGQRKTVEKCVDDAREYVQSRYKASLENWGELLRKEKIAVSRKGEAVSETDGTG